MAHIFLICVEKAKYLKDGKWDHICHKNWYYVDDVIKTKETSIISNITVSIENNMNG